MGAEFGAILQDGKGCWWNQLQYCHLLQVDTPSDGPFFVSSLSQIVCSMPIKYFVDSIHFLLHKSWKDISCWTLLFLYKVCFILPKGRNKNRKVCLHQKSIIEQEKVHGRLDISFLTSHLQLDLQKAPGEACFGCYTNIFQFFILYGHTHRVVVEQVKSYYCWEKIVSKEE